MRTRCNCNSANNQLIIRIGSVISSTFWFQILFRTNFVPQPKSLRIGIRSFFDGVPPNQERFKFEEPEESAVNSRVALDQRAS